MDKHSRGCTGRWLLEATIQLCVDGAITGEAAPWPSRGQVGLKWVPSVVSSAWSVMSRGKAALMRPGLREQSSQPGGTSRHRSPSQALSRQRGREGRKAGRQEGRSAGSARPLPALCQGAPDRGPLAAGNGGAMRGGEGADGAAALLPPRQAQLPPAGSGRAAEPGPGLPRWLAHGKAASPCGPSGSRAVAPRPGLAAAVAVSPVPRAGAAAVMRVPRGSPAAVAGAGPVQRRCCPGPR